MTPSVSIVIPAYNVASTIERCVRSALGQTGVEDGVEVIVVDNGSTDDTRQLLAAQPVTLVDESTRGHAAARNRGAREAKGSFIAFLDADCVAPPNWLSTALEALNRPWIGAAQARVRRHGQALPSASFLQGYYHAPFLSTQSLVVRREAFDAAGGYDGNMRRNVDVDFTFRVLARGYALAWLAEPVVVTYHYLPRARAWHRGLEGGKAGSQLENKWQELVGHKPKSRRYRDRIQGISKIVLPAVLDPDLPAHLVAIEQLGRLVSYTWTEAFGPQLPKPSFERASPVPAVLGERRFLILHGDEATIFDAAKEQSQSLDARETERLRQQIDEAWSNARTRSALT